ncbi:virion core protein, T7 gp14 family [Litchfieldella qijiaojingensis]|nr:hypothetical protein [Halomonas qijiaojingensis]
MTIAATTMAVASAGSMYVQHEQAEARAEYQSEMYQRNKQNSYDALAQRYGDIGERQSQEQQAAAERKEEVTRQARAQMATARVMAGESGVSGNSVDTALRDISGAAARDRSTIDQNLEWTLGQLQRQKQSSRTGTVNRINSVQPGQKPSNLALGLGAASSAAQGYMQYDSVKPES